MGTRKKEANRLERQGKTGDGMGNVRVKGENFYRTAKKAKLVKMYNEGKPQRNAAGKITKAASYQSRDAPVARVEPNRRWFNNTRVISQDALEAFRGAVAEQSKDPYSYLLKQNKLPMSLIRDAPTKNGLKQHAAKIAIETAPFGDTFGPKAQRKRPKLAVGTLQDLAGESAKMHDEYLDRLEQIKLLSGNDGPSDESGEPDAVDESTASLPREAVFGAGTSKRIWNELYKVIDSSDILLHILDARDPEGTRCRHVEKYIKTEAPHKHFVFILNKIDLVPSSVAATWVRLLSKEYPTLAFHASINNSFGKGSLIALLRQFSSLHSDRKQISVGFVGYPNVGKSSIINTLRKKAVAKVAPIAGETKVWQYVTLMKRIYLIDCPGIVPPSRTDRDVDLVMRGVVRIENVENPAQYMEDILQRIQPRHLQRTYDIKGYTNATEFLEMLARKSGRLLKGGEPDLDGVAVMVINAYLRGKIPWYMPPPKLEGEEDGVAGREGRLGEMGRKRKRDEPAADDILEDGGTAEGDSSNTPSDDEFEGFIDDDEDEEEIELNSTAEEKDARSSLSDFTSDIDEPAVLDSETEVAGSDSEPGG